MNKELNLSTSQEEIVFLVFDLFLGKLWAGICISGSIASVMEFCNQGDPK